MARLAEIDRCCLSKLLIELGLKRYWVAEVSGIHVTTLRRWLSGKIVRAKWDNVLSLSKVLDVPAERIARPTAGLT